MEIVQLYNHLKEVYTEENLGLISGRIIEMFRERRYDELRSLQKVVNEYTPCREEKINKVFSRLIMIFHPDRLNQSLKELEQAFEAGDFEALYAMSHILYVQNLEPEMATMGSVITEEDLAEEFGWDQDADGFYYFDDEEVIDEGEGDVFDYPNRSFLTAMKNRVYGNLNVDFPLYLLEDLEEVEMADYEIETLDGIEACRYARVVDLSNNNLTDLDGLGQLHHIERLYLSNNHIWMLDAISNLSNLQVLDISNNHVNDLSSLFELMHLNYLNVMGNRIPGWQLEELQKRGVAVVV